VDNIAHGRYFEEITSFFFNENSKKLLKKQNIAHGKDMDVTSK